MSTLSALNEAIMTRRILALSPCVNAETTMDICGQLMAFAQQVQGYLTSTQRNIPDLTEARDRQRDDLGRLPPSEAASSSHIQHDENTGPSGAHNRA